MRTYLQNLVKLTRGDFTLSPRLAVYYVTLQCNLNCAYCEDFGSRRNHLVTPTPSLANAKKILKEIRSGVDRLWLTGGEPLMVPYLVDLLACARPYLKFREISLITNGTLLSQNIKLLPHLDRLIISLDSIDPQALHTVSVPDAYTKTAIGNAREAASLQSHRSCRRIHLSIYRKNCGDMTRELMLQDDIYHGTHRVYRELIICVGPVCSVVRYFL